MSENRNASSSFCQDGRGTVCIDTQRVLDSCRDRDCFEDVRVYLSSFGEETVNSATSVRARSSKTFWTFVGVDEVPFNCGFFRVTVRYYITTEFEACLGIGRSQSFKGLSVLEKDVILYGGEGSTTSFYSSPENNFCSIGNLNNVGTNAPRAIVETVEPVILGTKTKDCSCPCQSSEYIDLPDCVRDCLDGEINVTSNNTRLYISLGVFSVIRIVRPAQLLVQASDYSVPDKECVDATNDDNPCSLFKTMSFPINRFKGVACHNQQEGGRGSKGCGCK